MWVSPTSFITESSWKREPDRQPALRTCAEFAGCRAPQALFPSVALREQPRHAVPPRIGRERPGHGRNERLAIGGERLGVGGAERGQRGAGATGAARPRPPPAGRGPPRARTPPAAPLL